MSQAAPASSTVVCFPATRGTLTQTPEVAQMYAMIAFLAIAGRQQLEDIVQAGIDALDEIDGDADLEAVSEDEGAQCDDEGVCGVLDPDNEPSLGSQEGGRGGSTWNFHSDPHGGGEGEPDGRTRADVIAAQRRNYPLWQNVQGYLSVRAL